MLQKACHHFSSNEFNILHHCVKHCVKLFFLKLGEGEIRCLQLDMVTKWIRDFQQENKQPDEEVVFDVLCGDFNFDNCSPGEKSLYSLFLTFLFSENFEQTVSFFMYGVGFN